MKIQVTFEKNAKKEFRQQCVKRLKSFVHQIKNQKQNKPNSIPQKSDQAYEMLNKDKFITQNSLSKRDSNKEQKTIKLFHQQFIDLKQAKSRQIEEIRKNDQKQNTNCIVSKFNPGNIRIQDKDQKNTSMKQMSDKVNKILEKFQKSEKLNQENSNNIDQKLELTNRKLDYLIQIAQKKIYPFNEAPQSINYQMGLKQTKKEEFQQKFFQLTKRYNKILQNNIQLKSSFCRAQFSPQQTRDSLTFRQI